ncbi:MAG: tetratricopeptide repeat protein, partial [Candidatus Thorarchaeota archaeon]
PYESVVADVRKNPEFEYLRVFLHLIETRGYTSEYEASKAISTMEKTLEITKKYDDQLLEANIEYIAASWIKHTDTKKALDYGLHAREIFLELGSENGLALIQSLLGHVMGMRGEYDAAIRHHQHAKELSESRPMLAITSENIITMYLLVSGRGNEALVIVNRIISSPETPPIHLPDFERYKAWALAILGRNEEARVEFDKFRKLAMKSGETETLIRMELLEAILEKSEKNIESASSAFEKLLLSFSDDPMPFIQNICLLNLVDIEIEMQYLETIDTHAGSSGKWMDSLEDYLAKNDFPGIAAQSKLLKAKFKEKQGRHDEAQLLLKQVLEKAESPSMRYLKMLVTKAFPELVQ